MTLGESTGRFGSGRSGWLALGLALALGCGGASSTSTPPAPPATAPTVTGLSPASGPVGTAVTVAGSHFTGATAVTFNGAPAGQFTVDSATQITATVPAAATTGPVAVTTPSGQAASATVFTVGDGLTTATLLPSGQVLPAGATSPRTLAVRGVSGAWTAGSNNAAWLTITAGATGTGDGSVTYLAAPNAGAGPRTGSLTVAGQTFTVWQNGTQNQVHPHLWVNPGEVAKLQGWATAGNPVYAQGLQPLLADAVTAYDTQFFPGGVQNPTWPDPGDAQGYTGLMSEQYAFVFAFNALIDPDPAARLLHAQRARNLIMVPLAIAAQGVNAGAPFQDPSFPIYNRAGASSELWPLIVDWLYDLVDGNGQPILTAADKAIVRTVFLIWAKACLTASTTGGDSPQLPGVLNDHALLPPFSPLDPTNEQNLPPSAYRMAANNYYLGHARLMTLMPLAIDPADDPPVAGVTAGSLGSTLGSYLADATGAWLYQEYAMYGEPAAIRTAYGLPAGSLVGLASGGLPPEGMLYGVSFGSLFGQLLALKTAGLDDPALIGPQHALLTTPTWQQFVPNFISSLAPAAYVPASESYLGPVYQMCSYGDLEEFYITNDFSYPMGLLGLLDQQNGVTTNLAAERWFMVNALMGGAGSLYTRISNPWTWGVQDAMLYYMMLDPALAAPADPRPSYPTTFYDAPLGRLVAHSDWTDQASMFAYLANWESINHQDADAGLFEFYRKGEWLTQELGSYSNTEVGQSSLWHNTLALQNWCAGTPPASGDFDVAFWQTGSQWPLAMNAGDPVTTFSQGSGFLCLQSDLTPLYNQPNFWTPANGLMDILHASRTIAWLPPDHVVVYDRATSQHAGLFKQFNLNFLEQPTIAGPVLTATTPNGQTFFVTTLLPASPAYAWVAIDASLNLADAEPAIGHEVIEDATHPADVRFLNVLQGADAGTPRTACQAFKDASGTAFDGVVLGQVALLFPVVMGTVPAIFTWTVPAPVQGQLITGLVPGTGYDLQTAGATFTLTAGTTYRVDAGGVLALGTIAP